MKLLKPVWRGFCIVSGLVMAPVLLALALAVGMGILPPWDQLRDLLTESRQASAASDASEESTEPGGPAPDDAPYWERRLNGVSSTIANDRADVDQRLVEAKELENKLSGLQSSLVTLLEATLDRTLNPEDLVINSEAIREELVALNSEEQRFPVVLNTAKTMSPKALATILTPDAENADGTDLTKSKKQTAKLLRNLKPRTIGRVLEAMAKIDAGFARELIESMGGAATSGLAEGK